MAEDSIVSENSKTYSTDEVLFFRDVIELLLTKDYLSSGDIMKQREGVYNYTESEKDALLERLGVDRWLQRSSRGYWETGPRTYLELRPFLESLVREIEESEPEEDALTRTLLAKLPQ
eukprot:CAMPEP_0182429286 /NCGR_PEP_ID=MMETSP1167-20130531/25656_1 /TAXON_ID=2988 /ORGANISM="Mallomonas Sp, Strain CCMP3275" /LENGTH=117 /DNA_ID=CAMNT_0024612713 /DNA_START=281 /DNA_END=631 /DNA_ORIENTATION=-